MPLGHLLKNNPHHLLMLLLLITRRQPTRKVLSVECMFGWILFSWPYSFVCSWFLKGFQSFNLSLCLQNCLYAGLVFLCFYTFYHASFPFQFPASKCPQSSTKSGGATVPLPPIKSAHHGANVYISYTYLLKFV